MVNFWRNWSTSSFRGRRSPFWLDFRKFDGRQDGSKAFLKLHLMLALLLQSMTKHKSRSVLKFMFSKKATKIEKSSPSIWHFLSKRQIDGEDFVIFCVLLRIHELYNIKNRSSFITSKFLSKNLSNENKHWCFCCLRDKMWIKMPILWKYWDSLMNFLK